MSLKMRTNKNFEVVHPCLDNIEGKLHLKLFRYMFAEPTLPKFNGRDKLLDQDNLWAINATAKMASEFDTEQEKKSREYEKAMKLRAAYKERPTFLQKVRNFFHKPDDPIETMDAVKDTGIASQLLDDHLTEAEQGLDRIMQRALDASQTKLVDEIIKHREVLKGQIILQKNGFDKYVTEKSIVQFIKRSRRGVRLDFIRNYTKMIPLSVLEIKKKADALKVFDNYVVMYYDPEWESWGSGNVRATELEHRTIRDQEREEERAEAERQHQAALERRRAEWAKEEARRQNARTSSWSRDPILFGLIDGSHRLYYVADWVTDEDDLTLEKLNIVVEGATQWLAAFNHDMEENFKYAWDQLENIKIELSPVSAEWSKD